MKFRILLATVACGFSVSAVAGGDGEFKKMCVTGLSLSKVVQTDCSMNADVDGKTYCFSSPKSKAMFMKDPKGSIKKAEAFYAKASKAKTN